jgi:hypothetical protein
MYLLCFAKSFVLVLDGYFVFVFSLVCYNLFSLSIMQVTGSPMAIWAIEANFYIGFNSLKALKGKSVISDSSFLRTIGKIAEMIGKDYLHKNQLTTN